MNVDVGLQVVELHRLKKGAFLLGKDPLGQRLNTTSVLGLSRPPVSEPSPGWSGMHKAIRFPIIAAPALCKSRLSSQAMPYLAFPKASQVIRDQVPPVPSLHFPSAKSGEAETSLMWMLSLQMFPKNFTFHFSL